MSSKKREAPTAQYATLSSDRCENVGKVCFFCKLVPGIHKKFITFFVILLVMITFFPQKSMATQKNKKTYIFVHVAFSLAQKMGSNDEYVPGENDFPITPAHHEYGVGCGLIINLSNRFVVQLSGDYLLGAEVKKEDPFDGETYMYKTYNNINVLGSLMFKFGRKNRFFISCGGGVNILTPYANKEVEGSLGSIIMLQAPDSKTNPMAAFGGGVILNMKKIIFKIEALYTKIFNYHKNSILLRLGFGF